MNIHYFHQDGFNNGYSHNAVTYTNGDHGAMAVGGFPGHGTTQYTSVHHHSISHNDGDVDDGYVDGGLAGGYAAGGPAAGGYLGGTGSVAGGYAGGAVVAAPANIAPVATSRYTGGVYGNRGGLGYNGRAYHPRHVHVGVGTPGVKVEVETAKSTISNPKAVHVTAQVINK